MKKGMKKFTADAESFNVLQILRNCIKSDFEVFNVKWGGYWDGMNWSSFSFFCLPKELEKIKSFCHRNQFNIKFS